MVNTAIISANPFIAEKYGIDQAILLNNFYLWTSSAPDNPNERTYFNGRYWINVSLKEMKYIFRHMSMSGLKRNLDKLIEQDLLLKDNFNLDPLQKTLWYALTDKAITICQNEQNVLFKSENNIYLSSYFNCILDNRLYLKYYNKINKKGAGTRNINNNINIYNKETNKLVKVIGYGKYQNVYLTSREFELVQQLFPNPSADIPYTVALDAVSEYLESYPSKMEQIQGQYFYYVKSFVYTKAVKNYKASIGETIKSSKHNKPKPSDKYTQEQINSLFTNLDEVNI